MRTIVAAVVMATTLGAVSTADAVTKRPVRPVAFSAEAEFGQAVPILRHGPMTLFLLCDNGLTRAGTGEPIDVASLFVRSKMDDMLVTGERNRPVPAGDAAHLFTGSVPDGQGWYTAPETEPVSGITIDFDDVGSGGSAISPDGFVLTVPADSVGFGIATYRFSAVPHSWEEAPDCFVTGFALLSKVPILD